MKKSLSDALKNEEFELFLQPLVAAQSGQIIAAEALARWNSPGGGLLLPGEFVPQMERYELVTELDFYMLERACRQLRVWDSAGVAAVPIFVNQSRAHVEQQDYVERVERVLDKTGVEPGRIVLELTENAASAARQKIKDMYHRLRGTGIRLAIDDYGVGYSSLSLVKDCAVDFVKLDQSFVQGLDRDRNRIILRGTIEMVRELGIQLVCEGVETARQLEWLTRLNCPIVQGFYCGAPMNADSFTCLLLENQSPSDCSSAREQALC